MTPAAVPSSGTADALHDALVRLASRHVTARREALATIYDDTVVPALRLALARARGDRVAAEEILARAYTEVRRVAGDYPAWGIRALPGVLAVVARA